MRASALLRGAVDLLLLIVFVAIAITGTGLYLAPSGRVAHTTGWTFLGMDREALTNVHTYLGFVMIGLVAVHLAVGFKSMLVMLKSAFRGSKVKTIAGLIIPLLLLAGGYGAFSAYVGGEEGDTTYDSYHEDSTASTVYITGAMIKDYTVEQLADEFNVSADALIEKLKENGIDAAPNEKLVEIEYEHDLDREEFKAMLEDAVAETRRSSE